MTPREELAFFLGSIASFRDVLEAQSEETLAAAVGRVVRERDELRREVARLRADLEEYERD